MSKIAIKKQSLVPIIFLAVIHLLFTIIDLYRFFTDESTGGWSVLVSFVLFVFAAWWFHSIHRQVPDTADLPTTWIILIPIYGYLRLAYKHSQFMEELTNQRYPWLLPFLLAIFINVFAMILFIQHQYNVLADSQPKLG